MTTPSPRPATSRRLVACATGGTRRDDAMAVTRKSGIAGAKRGEPRGTSVATCSVATCSVATCNVAHRARGA